MASGVQAVYLFWAPSIVSKAWVSTVGQTVKISVDELRAGVTCSHPVVGDGNVLLLGANTRITTQLLTGLRERGIEEIEVDPRDLAMLRGTKNKKKRTRTRHKKDTDDWERLKPVKDMLVDRYEESIDSERKQKVAQTISKTRSLFGDIARKLAAYEELTSVAAFKAMSDEFARSMVDDHDQTVGHVNGPEDVSDHRERSIRMAVLGMAIAVELGLDGYQTLDVGVAGMLHDVGLLLMDPLYRSPHSEIERRGPVGVSETSRPLRSMPGRHAGGQQIGDDHDRTSSRTV